ncbi:MAG TPA: hypothetical protein VF302_11545 [Candidatus Limnocylindrales bacterium]
MRLDGRFIAWALAWALVSLLAFGLVAAIIPNPVFGRQIPPEPFAIAVWLVSAPLMGLLGATYSAPAIPAATATRLMPLVIEPAGGASHRQGTTLGTVAGFGAFLAIGCPVCNKVALVLLGAGGAMTVFAPLQPLIGAASLVLLAGTLAWRFRLRARGGVCSI